MASDPDEPSRALAPVPLLAALQRHGVRYVAIGSFAAIAQGVGLPLTDLDIVPATDPANSERLVACLHELGAQERVGDEQRPIDDLRTHPGTLTDDSFRMFSTEFGGLDVVLRPAGFPRGYDDLVERVVLVVMHDESDPDGGVVEAPVAHIEDVYESKRRAGRRKDIEALPAFTGIHLHDPKEALRTRYREDAARHRRGEGRPRPSRAAPSAPPHQPPPPGK